MAFLLSPFAPRKCVSRRRAAEWRIPTRCVSEGNFAAPSLTYRVMFGSFHIAARLTHFCGAKGDKVLHLAKAALF